jgi:hypothetical protein
MTLYAFNGLTRPRLALPPTGGNVDIYNLKSMPEVSTSYGINSITRL